MPRKPSLRAVGDDEKPEPTEPARPKTVLEAAESGSRVDELIAMRRVIARALDNPNTSARDLAALSRRQIELGREIEAIKIAEDEDHTVVVHTDDEVFDGTGY